MLAKHLLLLTFFLCLSSLLFSQESFSLRGQLLIDKKVIVGAVVTVYDGKEVVAQTATNNIGKFWIELQLQKTYVLQFKMSGSAIQKVLVSTKSADLKGEYLKSKVVVFSLSSKNVSKEGPDSGDVVATFQVNDNGMLEEKKTIVNEPVNVVEKDIVQVDEKIENLEHETEELIATVPEVEKDVQFIEYKSIKDKKDSIILLAQRKAELIIKAAEAKSEEMTSGVSQSITVYPSDKNTDLKSDDKLKKELKDLAVKEEPFLKRDDIKTYKAKIDKYSDKKNLSKKDSLDYLENAVLFQDEIVKSARLQLEIDKLNARTREDSIAIQQRESKILLAEQEITQAKGKIELQRLEIRQKNTMLMFTISALLFFVLLSVMVYRSFINKKKTNAILEKHNLEIANKNKKIIDSIRYAQTIQQAILPIKSNIDKYFDWFLIFQPKDIVSGDFYWFNHFDDSGKSVFAVVDCTGHGVPGAFMSMIGNRLLIEAVKEKGIMNPVKILEEVDARIRVALMQDETSNNDGMDICVCTIEYIENNKCKIDFAGAKRPLFYSDKKAGKMKYLKGTVRGIGGKKRIREKPSKPFTEHQLILDKGEMLYLTTDGFFDLQSPNRKKFGRVNFMSILDEHYKKPLQEQKEIMMDALHLHKGSEFQIDDITILGIKL